MAMLDRVRRVIPYAFSNHVCAIANQAIKTRDYRQTQEIDKAGMLNPAFLAD
jgi:hypothetical protein